MTARHCADIFTRFHADDLDQIAGFDQLIVRNTELGILEAFSEQTRDFLALARTRPGHGGLVLVDDQNTRERQIAAIARIVTAMLSRRDAAMTGRVFTWRAASGRLMEREWP